IGGKVAVLHITKIILTHVGIVNGREAKPHSRPYMVCLQKNWLHVCGGFLISDEFVLTAAHCRENSETLTVVVGAHDLKNKTEGSVRVKNYIPHSNYKRPIWNDIMLLRETVKLNNYVKWISLPKNGEDVEANTLCSVAGWGRLWTDGPLSDRLMEANVYIMNSRACYKRWPEIDYSVSQMMCTYAYGGFCNGDSGGPLVCGDTAVGVVSFCHTYRCNSPENPNVYTKISAYIFHGSTKTLEMLRDFMKKK
uniref:Si:dkey-78l4.12 n=1 Tax=Sinocyclocheilus rhinocerous TaxID=307959 RepID=A0A673JM99_9TELE